MDSQLAQCLATLLKVVENQQMLAEQLQALRAQQRHILKLLIVNQVTVEEMAADLDRHVYYPWK